MDPRLLRLCSIVAKTLLIFLSLGRSVGNFSLVLSSICCPKRNGTGGVERCPGDTNGGLDGAHTTFVLPAEANEPVPKI